MVIIKNRINNMVTAIKDEIVFWLVPFKKNRIMILIMIQITNVGIRGLKPQPTMITKRKINARFM